METTLRFRFATFYDCADVWISDVCCRVASTQIPVTFHGQHQVCLSPQTTMCCDEIRIDATKEIILSYTLRSNRPIASGIPLYPYDEITTTSGMVYALQGIDVYGDCLKGCISVFGDSIVEMGNWTTPLTSWLNKQGYVLLNHGISGNRLCRDLRHVEISSNTFEKKSQKEVIASDTYDEIALSNQCFGKAGKVRFEPEVLDTTSNLSHVIFAIGVNDLYQPGTFCARPNEWMDEVTYQNTMGEVLKKTSKRKLECIVCTITPLLESDGATMEKEAIRTLCNAWIKQSIPLVIDFNRMIQKQDGALFDQYHNGDHLHPNELGGKVMAEIAKASLERWL